MRRPQSNNKTKEAASEMDAFCTKTGQADALQVENMLKNMVFEIFPSKKFADSKKSSTFAPANKQMAG